MGGTARSGPEPPGCWRASPPKRARQAWDHDGVRITTAVVPVDLLFRIAGEMSFHDVRARAKTFDFGGEALAVASLEDVIRSKEAADRKKDRAALPILRDTLAVKRKLELIERNRKKG